MNQRIHIVADLGNSFLKSKIVGSKYPVHAIPHALKFVDGGSWQSEAQAAKAGSRQADREKTQVFFMRGRGCIIGQRAYQANYAAPMIGEGKYSKDYFRYLMASQLLHHLPHGHDNVTVHVAHPPNAIPYLKDLMQSIGGAYNISQPDGEKVKYVVREVTTWDEPSGSMYMLLSDNTEYNRLDLNDGDTIFVCDFGGRISSMTTVEVAHTNNGYKLIPYFDDDDLSITFEGGAQTIMQTLATELRSFHSEDVKKIATKLTRNYSLLENVFRNHGTLYLKGQPHDVSQAFLYAISPFLDSVQTHYESRGLTSRIVALTGGSTSVLWDYLVNDNDKVIDHAHVRPVCDLTRVRFANLLGAEMAILKDIANAYE